MSILQYLIQFFFIYLYPYESHTVFCHLWPCVPVLVAGTRPPCLPAGVFPFIGVVASGGRNIVVAVLRSGVIDLDRVDHAVIVHVEH